MMTESGASVDSVTGELTTRLGAVGGVAGEAMRRSVRDAAGGAQTIASLVQADAAGARHIEPAGISDPARAQPGAADPAGPLTGTSPADPLLGSGERPVPGPPQDPPVAVAGTDPPNEQPDPGPADIPHAEAEAHSAPGDTPHPGPESTPGPKAPETATDPPGPHPGVPGPTADEPARTTAALPPADPVAAAAAASGGHTPWTAGAGAEQATGQPAGSTPWNSGAGSSMPYMPSMPGGLGSLTPQERPPRGSAPWSRGRGNKDGTVFPRPREKPDRPASTNRTEWAP